MQFQYSMKQHIATLSSLGYPSFFLRVEITIRALTTKLHRFEWLVPNALFLLSSVIFIIQLCRI